MNAFQWHSWAPLEEAVFVNTPEVGADCRLRLHPQEADETGLWEALGGCTGEPLEGGRGQTRQRAKVDTGAKGGSASLPGSLESRWPEVVPSQVRGLGL